MVISRNLLQRGLTTKFTMFGIVAVTACGSTNSGQNPAGVGGETTGTGGADNLVGGTSFGTGGARPIASGGSGGVGGPAQGGSAPATGGSRASGGASLNGGAAPTGGQAATGGTTVTATATGGIAATGGTAATTGGKSAMGGTATSTGGNSSTGGAQSGGNSAVATGGGVNGGAATGGGSSTGGKSASGGANTGGSTSTAATQWVGTWTASPYPVASGNMPPASLSGSVLRQVVHVSLGGSRIRLLLSNLSGNGAVTINAVHVAVCKATPAVDSTIDTSTDKALAFSGTASVTIAQGKEVWSDPVDFTVSPLSNVSITMAVGSVPSTLTGHAGSRTTSYEQTGSTNVSAANMASAQTVDAWYYISGIDVMADASAKAVVAIGDSITDGRGTDTNKNNRWTDILAARLHANASTANVAMLNQGIGATNLVGTSGTAAQARFSRDVLGQSGVKYAIVYDGVNDIGGGATFASMKSAYDSLISAAHAKGLLIYGGTILPFNGNSYYTAAHESVRQQVNTYIKSGVFDGIIDFDAALSDGGNPPKLQATYAAWSQQDWLHPGPAGYQKMGDTPDLALFAK